MKRVSVAAISGLLCFVAYGCKTVSRASGVKIVGGEDVAQSTDKRVMGSSVLLFTESNYGSGTCSGTLIGPTQIVTAAHCLSNKTAISIGYGPQPKEPLQSLKVTQFTPHPKFPFRSPFPVYEYDIGVVSFKGTLPPEMKPVTLAPDGSIKTGDELLLAGYGYTTQAGPSEAGILRQVRVKTAQVDTGHRILEIEAFTNKGGCLGDSGGPAYLDDGITLRLVGATHGPGIGMEQLECDAGQGTFTLVNRYQGWMKCIFTSHGNPLEGLADDASNSDCPEAAGKWCDPNNTAKCYSYCTNGSDTGDGFGWQAELGGSCKVK